MKNFFSKALFYYSAIAAFLITISTVFTSQTIGPVIFTFLFLPITAYFVIEFFKQLRGGTDLTTGYRKGEMAIMILIFLILLVLGSKNIYTNDKISQPSPPPSVFKPEATASPAPETTLTISITDGSPSVNIREKPTIYSEKVGEAKNGDVYEYTQKTGEWYEVKLEKEKVGYISFKYIKEVNK